MKNIILGLMLAIFILGSCKQEHKVTVLNNAQGIKLVVNGEGFMINGMNWDYFPVGTNFEYSLWKQSDEFIKLALDEEMTLLKNMGVNTIRVYAGIQPKWITYIYENYGIYTMLNHSFGRYGVALNGSWTPITDYRNLEVQKVLLSEVTQMAKTYKNTPGLLLFLLGNENNYGLFWAGAETEDFPDDENQKRKLGEERGRPMYKLFNEAAKQMKLIDANHPVAICNGDLLFLDMIADECPDVDIFGTNMYRGASFGDVFTKVKMQLKMPILFTEFGADAFNSQTNLEDQKMQAYYMKENWKEIYLNAAGLGKANNSIGGFTFQFSDGWWKLGQTKNLNVHDKGSSWANGGYKLDFEKGTNNMNEEWFGVCAKDATKSNGTYKLYPRAAYYALKEVHKLNPYKKEVTTAFVANYFNKINIDDALRLSAKNKVDFK
ncbi:glycoside hydrolase family 2 TIM barrel-domain containing protein [Polaribacter ponticola]|uniref:Glycoside hydrolase family 2 TIM barrel-domain containing protein n=1 Tax=Polaribacter ponticola TaxID=2978475 RepID=A0ABT5S8F3_9FLAO|nr:glycoside hydrolase family 2 TIM barrel-domain containing protein [Polaribacter sp. MSW5]MDD7914390.1 glycoside hydrolase family 2 TIM barrel-domain containing protein [Polaribacter sp. MSW5]